MGIKRFCIKASYPQETNIHEESKAWFSLATQAQAQTIEIPSEHEIRRWQITQAQAKS